MNFVSTDITTAAEASPMMVSEEAISYSPSSPPDTQSSDTQSSDTQSSDAQPDPKLSKAAIRTSLRASTWDGLFAAIFSNITGGVLLSNFLVELHANPIEIGLLSSVPMVANLLQPLGAYVGDRTTSRHWYCLWIYGPARLLWLILVVGIAIAPWVALTSQQLIYLTLTVVCFSYFLGALGSASWLSWLATLVPRRLRGRYFGIRNSVASLTTLISVPLAGLMVSRWPGDSIQGYAAILVIGIVAGLISLGFQYWMVDVNPQIQKATAIEAERSLAFSDQDDSKHNPANIWSDLGSLLKDLNFLRFLLYFGGWAFAVNVSAPFFNLYLLDNLGLDVSWVTLYNSLSSGANLLMLLFWGKLADRLGNRSILVLVGILVALTPILWLGTGATPLSIWLWFPALHILAGGTWAAIDLCTSNMQLGVAPVSQQANYFAIAAAIAGVSGALGATAGGFLAQFADYGGLPGLFALSSVLRLLALVPLVFVHEQRGQSLGKIMQILFPRKTQSVITASEK
jgi:MFS family permease